MENFITTSEHQTIDLGKRLAHTFKGGEVLALHGDLGAGKTTLIKGIARGLGIKKVITSPTFIVMNVYKVRDLRCKIKEFIHIDCYRIKNEKDIFRIGAADYFGRPDTVVVIEWAEKIKKILPLSSKDIIIKYSGERKRIFWFSKRKKSKI